MRDHVNQLCVYKYGIQVKHRVAPKQSKANKSVSMSVLVSKSDPEFIGPCRPTPSGMLPFSVIDCIPGLRCIVRTLHVFEQGREPARAIRQALSEALVHYYPLAGRLVEPSPVQLSVECTGEGVLFVEAVANCSLQDVNYVDHPFMISIQDLLPETKSALPLMMQVTEFSCGGFVVGVKSVHAAADGIGVAQFLNAVSELARGLPRPTVEPVWCRELIPSPTSFPVTTTTPPDWPNMHLQHLTLHLPLDYINRLKNQFFQHMSQRCSTFDILIATIWQCRTRAIDVEHDHIPVHLCFMANVRQLLHQVLPNGGYYGNCFYPVKLSAASGKITDSPIIDVVKLIRDAKAQLPTQFMKWSKGEFDEDPYDVEFNYETLFASDWTHLGFNDVDYGWGNPVRVLPFEQADFMPICVPGLPSPDKASCRLMTVCVEKKHLAAFRQQVIKLA